MKSFINKTFFVAPLFFSCAAAYAALGSVSLSPFYKSMSINEGNYFFHNLNVNYSPNPGYYISHPWYSYERADDSYLSDVSWTVSGNNGLGKIGSGLGSSIYFGGRIFDEGQFDVTVSGSFVDKQNLSSKTASAGVCDYTGCFATQWRYSYNTISGSGVFSDSILSITVENVAPIIKSITALSSVAAGDNFYIDAVAYDPGVLDVLTYSWDLNGDGIFDDLIGSSGFTNFATAGLHTIALQVDDGDGGIATSKFDVNVISNLSVSEVPEPNSLALVAAGLFAAIGMQRRKLAKF